MHKKEIKMFVPVEEPFTDKDGNIYEIDTVKQEREHTTYQTYLLEKDSDYAIGVTSDPDYFDEFYSRGWTKEEVETHLKKSWVIQKDWQLHIEDLEALLDDYGQAPWLNLEAWTYLPTVQAFYDWLDTDFLDAWEESSDDPDFMDETTAKLVTACEKLYKAMEENPNLIQAIDPKSKRVEKKGKTTLYATKDEAVENEIIRAIEAGKAGRDEYDIDAIAKAVIDSDESNNYYVRDDVDFWYVLAANRISQ